MNDPKKREAVEKAQGKEFVKKQLAKAEKAKVELDGLKKSCSTQYGDLVTDLSIGNAAPEISIQAIRRQGSAARRLSKAKWSCSTSGRRGAARARR